MAKSRLVALVSTLLVVVTTFVVAYFVSPTWGFYTKAVLINLVAAEIMVALYLQTAIGMGSVKSTGVFAAISGTSMLIYVLAAVILIAVFSIIDDDGKHKNLFIGLNIALAAMFVLIPLAMSVGDVNDQVSKEKLQQNKLSTAQLKLTLGSLTDELKAATRNQYLTAEQIESPVRLIATLEEKITLLEHMSIEGTHLSNGMELLNSAQEQLSSLDGVSWQESDVTASLTSTDIALRNAIRILNF
jgi:hypothetical protein